MIESNSSWKAMRKVCQAYRDAGMCAKPKVIRRVLRAIKNPDYPMTPRVAAMVDFYKSGRVLRQWMSGA